MNIRRLGQFNALIGFAAILLLASPPSVAQDKPSGDKAAQIKEGEYLARAGDCVACHTAPTGKLFAGGLAMPTPFGTLYSTNITPDPETGIGKWNADDF
jgi:mono/diheme cytochrome c family protein